MEEIGLPRDTERREVQAAPEQLREPDRGAGRLCSAGLGALARLCCSRAAYGRARKQGPGVRLLDAHRDSAIPMNLSLCLGFLDCKCLSLTEFSEN